MTQNKTGMTCGDHVDINKSNLDRYNVTKQMYLKVLPPQRPGLTEAEVIECLITLPPKKLFPNSVINQWCRKNMQLDQEAKGVCVEPAAPLRLHKV